MSSRETSPKHRLLGHLAALARSLGHEHRLELLEILGQGERTVEALAARSGQPFANTSQHLQHLRRAGLVETRREGKHVVYRLRDDGAATALLGALRNAAERNLAEVQAIVAAWLGSRDGLEPVSREELAARVNFQPLNLLAAEWALPGPFDAIFCRNVMIYFDKPTQERILRRFVPLLKPGGLLFAGHSENFSQISRDFYLRGQTVYGLTKEK